MDSYEDYRNNKELKAQIQDDFSTALKYYMRRDKVRQQDLVESLGISSSTVSNWVAGNRIPRPAAMAMLAQYFHVSEEDMRRLPAWVDFADVGNANIENDLLNLSRIMSTVKSVSIGREELPTYIVQNLISAIKVALDYANDAKTKKQEEL